jgi:hypothetical protein
MPRGHRNRNASCRRRRLLKAKYLAGAAPQSWPQWPHAAGPPNNYKLVNVHRVQCDATTNRVNGLEVLDLLDEETPRRARH